MRLLVGLPLLALRAVGGHDVPARAAGGERVRRDHLDAGLDQVVPGPDPLRVALADDEDDHGVGDHALVAAGSSPSSTSPASTSRVMSRLERRARRCRPGARPRPRGPARPRRRRTARTRRPCRPRSSGRRDQLAVGLRGVEYATSVSFVSVSRAGCADAAGIRTSAPAEDGDHAAFIWWAPPSSRWMAAKIPSSRSKNSARDGVPAAEVVDRVQGWAASGRRSSSSQGRAARRGSPSRRRRSAPPRAEEVDEVGGRPGASFVTATGFSIRIVWSGIT